MTKQSHAEYMREWRKTHKENPEKRRERMRKWRAKNRERNLEHQQKHRLRKGLAKKKEYREKNPQKVKAGRIALNLPLAPECELCPDNDKRTEGLERHHPDYDEPEIFVTVCSSCHKWIDERRVKT